MAERRSSKQLTLQDRLSAWAEKTREQADKLEPGPARDALLKKIEQAAKAAGEELLGRFPMLRVEVYNAETKHRTKVRAVT